mgnify:CR=1 FL=1|jgi:hypothetical protein
MGQGSVHAYLRCEFRGGGHAELRAQANQQFRKVLVLWFALSPLILAVSLAQLVLGAVFPPFEDWLVRRYSNQQTHRRQFYALAFVPAFKYVVEEGIDFFVAYQFTFFPLVPMRDGGSVQDGEPIFQQVSPRFVMLAIACAGYLLQDRDLVLLAVARP